MPTDDLGTVLAVKFPEANSMIDYMVENHGDVRGTFIAYWDEGKLGPQPTAADLVKWMGEIIVTIPVSKEQELENRIAVIEAKLGGKK
jgi:hypothetical protein